MVFPRAVGCAVATGLLTLAVVPAMSDGQCPGPPHATPTGAGADSCVGSLPLQPTRTIRFSTSEGAWMSVDVSPDGTTVLFDLLGDLYTVPIAGGRATRLTSGPAFDAMPRYSPDGKSIVFVSNRDGADNLWLIDADGTNARPLTRGASAPVSAMYRAPFPGGWRQALLVARSVAECFEFGPEWRPICLVGCSLLRFFRR